MTATSAPAKSIRQRNDPTDAAHVVIIDDDNDMRRMVARYLDEFGLRVSSAADARTVRKTLNRTGVDLIVFDLRITQEQRMRLMRELRNRYAIPIIILTSSKDEVDRIMGLELGADDCLSKPFNPRELLARIRAVLRRTKHQSIGVDSAVPRAYRFSDWELDTRTRRVNSVARTVNLTHAEYELLMAFLAAPQRILSREQLLNLMHGGKDSAKFDRSIDVQILRLRHKIELNPRRPKLIKTERGLGYSFVAEVKAVH